MNRLDVETKKIIEELIKSGTLGIHFTPKENVENMKKNGIKALIGDNSSGGLGKEAIKKAFFTLGLLGHLDVFNRSINAGIEEKIETLRDSKTHSKYVPEDVKDNNREKNRFSVVEAFEFLDNYFGDCDSFIFEAKASKYENEVSDDKINEINGDINRVEIREIDKILEANAKLKKLSEDECKKLKQKRDDLVKNIRQKTIGRLERGKEKEDGLYDEVDFNEEHVEWQRQPHNNIHTKIEGEEISSLKGKDIYETNKNVDTLILVEELMKRKPEKEEYARKSNKTYDIPMIEAFMLYRELPNEMKKDKEIGLMFEKYYRTNRFNLRNEKKIAEGKVKEVESLAEFFDNDYCKKRGLVDIDGKNISVYDEDYLGSDGISKLRDDIKDRIPKKNKSKSLLDKTIEVSKENVSSQDMQTMAATASKARESEKTIEANGQEIE